MFEKLEAMTRHMMGNRRRAPRLKRRFDVLIHDEHGREVFRGQTLDISSTGTRIRGFPQDIGVCWGQNVSVNFLIIPKEKHEASQRIPVAGRIARVDEMDGDFLLAVKFDHPIRVE